MTKLVLAGGYVHKAPDGGKAFCEELVRGKETPIRILICMFARLREKWNDAYEKDQEFFTRHLPETDLIFELAEYDTFIKQVQRADVIYLRGGSSTELMNALEQNQEWKNYIDGKTVAGTSAGADALATYYFGLHDSKIREGVKLASMKVIPHYGSDYHGWDFDWEKARQELEAYGEPLPVLALKEGEFKVIEV